MITYQGIEYPTRKLRLEYIPEHGDGEVEYVIAGESLGTVLMKDDGGYTSDEAYDIDIGIYYFVDDKILEEATGEEIAREHLDIEFKFIEEL